ncbi:uncharacterized protein LOC120633635 [Pararge aegeria]|uniref:Jg3778 protein n=2 Tax=Pararge aegeria TaxID=116150 RepID=A0A8S4SQQ3_9NEOP|nr:uncharacterized protein LOC120633635 [Pararge aegeria]CAH2268518.1 jg3778 [Pararge aegeria aegeria]
MNSNYRLSSSDYSDSDTENEFDICCAGGSCSRGSGACSRESGPCALLTGSSGLPFDPTSIENVILSISDQFNFRVLLNDSRAQKAVLITAGLTLAGSLIGKHYGGKAGAAVGGAIGGVCGLGVVVVSMRDIWQDVKGKLWELFDIVYDYLAGLGIEDYEMAAKFLVQNSGQSSQLAMVILQYTSSALGKKILSTLTAL